MTDKAILNVVRAFGDVLDRDDLEPLELVPSALPESLLPCSKIELRRSIALLLLDERDLDRREILEESYLFLDNFISDQDYQLFLSYDILVGAITKSDRPEEKASSIPQKSEILEKAKEVNENIRKRWDQALEEIRTLRRIIGLPEDISDLIGEEA